MNCIFCHSDLECVIAIAERDKHHCNNCGVSFSRHNEKMFSIEMQFTYEYAYESDDRYVFRIDLTNNRINLYCMTLDLNINLPLQWIFPSSLPSLIERLQNMRAFL